MVELATTIWADGPALSPYEPQKSQIRAWGAWIENIITAFTSNGGLIYSSLALLNADLAHVANSMAWVIGDPVAVNNGVYGKVGASGVGSWTRRSDLPFSFIVASDVGAGTPNAIQATTSIPVSGSALIWMNIADANGAGPTTVQFNGSGTVYTIKTNSGNDPSAGGLVSGMIVLGVASGTTFRLVSDQASAAIVAAAEAAADRAELAAASIELPGIVNNTLLGTAGGVRVNLTPAQARSLLGMPTLQSFNAVGDGATNDTAAVAAAEASGVITDGRGLTYAVTVPPTDFSRFRNAAFLYDGKLFRTDDYLDVKKYQITKTLTYTDWAQDKACMHDGVWIVPFQLAHGHTYDTTRIAWAKSFDKGQTWQAPEVILDQHPEGGTGGTKGWNCFAAGVVGNRFVMMAEERDVATEALLRVIMRDIVLDRTYYMTNGIQLTAGSPLAVITLPNHGLVAGDRFRTSGITGTDVAGLGGQKTVHSVIDKDYFRVDKGSNSASDQANTGGSWQMGHTFYDNVFRETVIPNATLQNGLGQMPTHIHSFAVKDAGNGEFFVGFHNGSSSPREVGVIHVQSLSTTPTFTKRRIPSTFESSAAEPALQYEGTRLYLTTRGQSASVEGSSFGYSDDSGVTWTFARMPGNIHNTPLPFEIINGTLYIFGSERGENEWNQGAPDNRNSKNRPRSFMMRLPLSEAVAGNFANMTTTLLGYEIYEGEQVSSGVGVGSTIYDPDEGKLVYFLSSEDFRNSTRYSLNSPSVDDESLAWGYQPDIYAYEIVVAKPRAGLQRFELRGPDMQSLPVFRYGNNRKVDVSVRYKEDVVFETKATATELESSNANVALSERPCPTNPAAATTLVLPQGYGLYLIEPGAGPISVTALTRAGTGQSNCITIAWRPGASGGAVTFVDGGFLRLGANRVLSNEAMILKLQRIGSYWHEIGYFSN